MGLGYSYYAEGALAWFEDGDEGAIVGQEFSSDLKTHAARVKHIANIEAKLANALSDDEERSYFAVEIAVAKFALGLDASEYQLTRGGWCFETNKRKIEAMKVAKAAIKVAKSDKPWPEWAVTALANGWTPPKSWKP